MGEVIYPELNYRMFIKCDDARVIDGIVAKASQFAHWYKSVTVRDGGVCFEADNFTNLQCVISFYKSAVAMVDNTPFNDVRENTHLDFICVEIDYVSRYWANRCLQELQLAIAQCGCLCMLSSPVIDGNTASVVCSSWDALSELDRLIMRAGRGYSTHPDCCSGNSESIFKKIANFFKS